MATVRDIGKITNAVEEVKIKFNADTEYLKSELSRFSQSFHSIKSLERDALINVSKKYSEWLHTLSGFSLAHYSIDNYTLLKEKSFLFFQRQEEFEVAEDNLHLYIHDEEIRTVLLELKKLTLDYTGAVIKSIILFIGNCESYLLANKIISDDKKDQLEKFFRDRDLQINNNNAFDLIEHGNKIASHHIQFKKLVKHRIYQLLTK